MPAGTIRRTKSRATAPTTSPCTRGVPCGISGAKSGINPGSDPLLQGSGECLVQHIRVDDGDAIRAQCAGVGCPIVIRQGGSAAGSGPSTWARRDTLPNAALLMTRKTMGSAKGSVAGRRQLFALMPVQPEVSPRRDSRQPRPSSARIDPKPPFGYRRPVAAQDRLFIDMDQKTRSIPKYVPVSVPLM